MFRTVPVIGLGSHRVDDDLHALLLTLAPKLRDDCPRVLIRDHGDRDAIAMQLMRYPDENGQRWADVIDFLTMYPDARRQVVRLLGEMDAHSLDWFSPDSPRAIHTRFRFRR